MGLKDIKAGKYRGHVSVIKHPDTGEEMTGKVVISSKGTQGIQTIFEFERVPGDASTKEKLMWTGWLTEATETKAGTKEKTFETFALLGFNENIKLIGNEQFLPRSSFPVEPVIVELVVDLEPQLNQDQTPKLDQNGQAMFFPRISWVNGPNKFGFAKSEQGAMLTGINLKHEMMIARQKLGLDKQPQGGASKPFNHAPGANNAGAAGANAASNAANFGAEPSFNTNEDIPF